MPSPPPARSIRRTRTPAAARGCAGPGTAGFGCASRVHRAAGSGAQFLQSRRLHRHRIERNALAREVEGLFGRSHRVSLLPFGIRGIAAWPTVTLDWAGRSRHVAGSAARISSRLVRRLMSSSLRMPRARRSPIARMRAAWGMGSSSGWDMPKSEGSVGGARLHPSISAAETKVLRILGGGRQNLRWQHMHGQWRRSDGHRSSTRLITRDFRLPRPPRRPDFAPTAALASRCISRRRSHQPKPWRASGSPGFGAPLRLLVLAL